MACRLILATLLPVLGACQSPTTDVRRTIEGLIEADNASDADRVAAYYADNAVLMPPAGPSVTGREAIRRRYEDGFRRFHLEVLLRPEGTRVAGDLAFDRGVTEGNFVWRDGREPTSFADKYLMVLKKTGEGWRVAVLMWSPAGR